MKRLIILTLLACSLLQAETVYLTPKGKTYHANRTCMSLSRAKNVLTADDADAKAHGLHQCGICYRSRKAKTTTTGTGNSAWAKGVK